MSERVKVTVVQGPQVENLWAQPLSEGRYKIDNIPFEIRGISLGDIVAASERNDYLYFDGLVEKSGNGTIWIQIKGGLRSSEGQEILTFLRRESLEHETYGDTLIALNVAPNQNADELLILVESFKLNGVDVAYETADPTLVLAVPTVPGSRAEQQQREYDAGSWDRLEDMLNEIDEEKHNRRS